MTGRVRWAAVIGLAILAAGCARGQKDDEPGSLLNLRSRGTPDEFAILPNKPLVEPEDYAALPEPTPGVANLADPTPEADVALALGGNIDRARSGDAALIAATTRFGVQPDIRADLAAADRAFRSRNEGRLLERIFNVNVYFKAYKPYELDQYAELERFQRAGIPTSAPPPDPAK